ncbi:hypothetical protein IWQ60_007224 [Tieghemiomyces parasiticus]|uniref:Carbohydrate-binding module family 19 domain-containing protein n=1 Tax=Tieghemiomyces parasiticus TaxID=78921 RepID=A0A9W8A3R5_9FUNG|nr:hypothetical protein IWQ60_007224 [Tieghemiomyces parasiticus]
MVSISGPELGEQATPTLSPTDGGGGVVTSTTIVGPDNEMSTVTVGTTTTVSRVTSPTTGGSNATATGGAGGGSPIAPMSTTTAISTTTKFTAGMASPTPSVGTAISVPSHSTVGPLSATPAAVYPIVPLPSLMSSPTAVAAPSYHPTPIGALTLCGSQTVGSTTAIILSPTPSFTTASSGSVGAGTGGASGGGYYSNCRCYCPAGDMGVGAGGSSVSANPSQTVVSASSESSPVGEGQCADGYFRCRGTNGPQFDKCDHGKWVGFECGPGTVCQEVNEAVVCAYPGTSSLA